MRRRLAQMLPEGHWSIEKRSCKQPDSNARPKHQNVSFSAHCRSVWGVLSLVTLFYGNGGTKFPNILTREFTAVSPGKPKELLDVRGVMLNQSGSRLFEPAGLCVSITLRSASDRLRR